MPARGGSPAAASIAASSSKLAPSVVPALFSSRSPTPAARARISPTERATRAYASGKGAPSALPMCVTTASPPAAPMTRMESTTEPTERARTLSSGEARLTR